ncbi:hypothetical protein K474DRAFT_1505708 [Panus rudis PR-1116 ss-1]|nr:hypothetical protein K474DRAFT_1505708 [Panus rudis PR-1116 ss-1]
MLVSIFSSWTWISVFSRSRSPRRGRWFRSSRFTMVSVASDFLTSLPHSDLRSSHFNISGFRTSLEVNYIHSTRYFVQISEVGSRGFDASRFELRKLCNPTNLTNSRNLRNSPKNPSNLTLARTSTASKARPLGHWTGPLPSSSAQYYDSRRESPHRQRRHS